MMQIICKAQVLLVHDVKPRVRLVKGKIHTLSPAAFARSSVLQAALRRGDIAVYTGSEDQRATPAPSAKPVPRKAARRVRKPATDSAPVPDMTEVTRAVEDLRGLHNLFVQVAGEMQGRPAPEVDESTLAALQGLQASVEGLSGRLDQIEARMAQPVTVVTQHGVPTPTAPTIEEHTPIFIPSVMRTETGDMNLEVETKTEDSDLGDAEAALRAMRKSRESGASDG